MSQSPPATILAVFLDRDGVLSEDNDMVTRAEQLRLLPGVVTALGDLKQAGFALVAISNQAVVARGLVAEADVATINDHLDRLLQAEGAPPLDGWYVCPHHPNATLPAYRLNCECRKPKPGLLLRAAKELDINLTGSFMVGDRMTDVLAGHRASCRTVLVQTGKHTEPPIETSEALDMSVQPDHICADLAEAAKWILKQR